MTVKRFNKYAWVLCSGLVWLLACDLFAASISLVPSASVSDRRGQVTIRWKLENTGDALAENVRVTVETPFGESLVEELGHLDPGDSLSWTTSYGHTRRTLPGRYAALLRIRYKDQERYAFDALAAMPYNIGKTSNQPAVAVALEQLLSGEPHVEEGVESGQADPYAGVEPIEHSGLLRLTILPLTESKSRLRIRLALPEAFGLLSDLPEEIDFPTSTFITDLAVTNYSGVAGSRLPIIAMVETSAGGEYYASLAETTVRVGGTPPTANFPKAPVPVWLALAALALWLVCEIYLRFVRPLAFRKNVEAGDETSVAENEPPAILKNDGESDGLNAGEELNRREQGRGSRLSVVAMPGVWLDIVILAAVVLLLGSVLSARLMLADTLAVGGDTPAHHYLMRYLREQLFSDGRIVGWAPGWWSGFPIFQFYFPLPYLIMVLLDLFLPTNVAFKIGTMLGIYALPFCAYAAGRLLRLPRPLPALLALASAPLLLDTTQTMWGVNISSTLAGMISNSYSFALLLPALASAVRDAFDAMPRPRTVILLVLVVLSHFFTAIFAAILLTALLGGLAIRAVATRKGLDCDRALALLPLGIMTFLLMAWWLLPLVATRAWSVDFGDPWNIRLMEHLPIIVKASALPALAATLLLLVWRRVSLPRGWRMWAGLHLLMFVAAVMLFFLGSAISPVFVNCRLWPFMVYALLTLAALTVGWLAWRSRVPLLATVTLVLLVFAWPWDAPNQVRDWSAYNFGGTEDLADGWVLHSLAERLKGTSGRLAYDLHPGNEQLGSSRAFESLPALCGKPVLEGGIVNSALGSIAAYTVQGEMSDGTAGWPSVVKPRSFDPAVGLRRLEFLGVRHFVARSRRTQAALEQDLGWEMIEDYGKWQLFESGITNASPVRVWGTRLPVVETTSPQEAMVEWLGEPQRLVAPAILLRPGEMPPEQVGEEPLEVDLPLPQEYLDIVSEPVPLMVERPGRIRFQTTALGQPHLIAVSYFPNWKVKGARKVYPATPGYMVIFPEERDVELRFGSTVVDRLGNLLSLAGLALLIFWLYDIRRSR